MGPQKLLGLKPNMEGAAPSRKEGIGPSRSSLFLGVVAAFPGISRTTLRGTGEDDSEEEDNSVKEEGCGSMEDDPTSVGESQGTGGQL
ncbi:hypothetical protein O181_040885 [Austropuccinia psidii MF-1]|uniref:Uncharacterized protein n=1 Tax=Austropuccinia psidii MF-1 TaxID=1389203 RepID=A0A9Q3DHN8_9BASI|nr:hypothetical protein [Austropuccinia psidii MF-1]